MPVTFDEALRRRLHEAGVECFLGDGTQYPEETVLEAPCSLKWLQATGFYLRLGAFSYLVAGHACGAEIGRYVSGAADLDIGRQSHPTTWVSTSPAFYLGEPLFSRLGDGFEGAREYEAYRPHLFGKAESTRFRPTTIGHDVYIGQAARIGAGVTLGTGSIVAAGSVVVKDVPPYAIVGGNPAQVLRMRLPETLIEGMLASQWWRFAPWQLDGLPFHEPERFLDAFARRAEGLEPFKPTVIDFREWAGA